MAYSQGTHVWKSRRGGSLAPLAPAQLAALGISSFLVGIAAAGGGFSFLAVLAATFCVGLGLFAWKRSWSAVILLFLTCVAGIFYYHLYFTVRAAGILIPFETQISFSGIVAAEPGHSAKSEYFPLRLNEPHRGVIRVVSSPDNGFRYGDELEVSGRVLRPEMERDLPVSLFPRIERIGEGQGSFVRQALSDFKYRLLSIFPRYLPAEEAAFLGGITLGARASFSPEFINAMAASGTTHLVALSGYNIAILVFVVFGGCLHFFGRRVSFYLTTIAILLFAAMVGAEPSVVRASGMAFVVLLARELGRPYGLPYALLWTALFMILFNPSSLFMPGFQLSFISLLGIVYLSPVVLGWLGKRHDTDAGTQAIFLGGLRENVALTIAAQLAVAPIVLHNFGAVSLTSFVANAAVLPFIPVTMLFGFILLACGLIFPPLGVLAGLGSRVLLAYEVGMINFFAMLSLPVTTTLAGFGIVFYYFLFIILIRRHQLKENER